MEVAAGPGLYEDGLYCFEDVTRRGKAEGRVKRWRGGVSRRASDFDMGEAKEQKNKRHADGMQVASAVGARQGGRRGYLRVDTVLLFAWLGGTRVGEGSEGRDTRAGRVWVVDSARAH